MKSNYKVIPQREEYDCAAACLSMILKNYFYIDFSIFELKPVIKNVENGTKFSDLYRGMKQLGISSTLCRGSLDSRVFDEIKYPVITQIKTEGGYHYVVLFSKVKKRLIIGDPNSIKEKKIKINKFIETWVPVFISIDIEKSNLKIEKSAHSKKFTIFECVKKVKLQFAFMIIVSVVTYILGFFLSGMFNLYFDLVIPQKLNMLLPSLVVIYLIVNISNQFLMLLQNFVNIKASKELDKEIFLDYFNGIFNKPKYAINEFNSAEFLTDISNITTIRERVVAAAVKIPVDVMWVIVSLSVLIKTNFKLSLLTLIMLLTLLYAAILPNSRYEILSNRFIDSMTKFNNYLMDYINNIIVIKELKKGDSFVRLFEKKYSNLLTKRNKLINFDSLVNTIRHIISSSFTIVLFSVGVNDIINGNLSTGTLLMFNSILGFTVDPLLEIASFQSLLTQGKVASNRLNMVMSRSEYNKICLNKIELSKIKFIDILVERLYFSFDANHKLLNDVNFYIRENANVAIIGENGSGKTTIGKLVCKLLLPDSGNIKLGSMSIDAIPESIIDERVLFVNTNDKVINDTVFNNIDLYRNIPKETIIRVSKEIGLFQDLKKNGISLSTSVGSEGTKLSFGQIQMIKVLQSTVVLRDIYIFDEITNGLDKTHEELVLKYILKLPGIKIFLTHDERVVSKCNQVLSLIDGHVKEIR